MKRIDTRHFYLKEWPQISPKSACATLCRECGETDGGVFEAPRSKITKPSENY